MARVAINLHNNPILTQPGTNPFLPLCRAFFSQPQTAQPPTLDPAKMALYLTLSTYYIDKDASKLYIHNIRDSPQKPPFITCKLPPLGTGGILHLLHQGECGELNGFKTAWKDIPVDAEGNFLLYQPSDADSFSLLYRSIHYILLTMFNTLHITELEFFHGLALVEQVHLYSKPEARLQISLSNVAMMISIGVLIAHKFHSDRTYTNATFSKFLLLSLSSVCSSERYFLQAIDYHIMSFNPESVLSDLVDLFSH